MLQHYVVNNMSFAIRQLNVQDYDAIINILAQLTTIDKTKITKDDYGAYVGMLTVNRNHLTIVVENLENVVVGTATLLVEPKLIHNLSHVGHIEDVVVDNQHRKEGIGKLMIEYLSTKAKSMGCYKVILDCDEDNCPFYEKCGFQKKGIEMALYFK